MAFEIAWRTFKWNSYIARPHHPGGDVSARAITIETKNATNRPRVKEDCWRRRQISSPKKEYYQLSKELISSSLDISLP